MIVYENSGYQFGYMGGGLCIFHGVRKDRDTTIVHNHTEEAKIDV